MKQVSFRFYEELNVYLPEGKRKVWVDYFFSEATSIKAALQSMEIPLEAVDLILVNQQSRGLDYMLQDGDMISVFPVFELFDLTGVSQVRESPLRDPMFICDVHLGRLCKYLRMFGYDTLYSNGYTPEQIMTISTRENRIILSRSRPLTRHKSVTHAYWVRSSIPLEQVTDLIRDLDLSGQINPLTRCLNCNSRIFPVEKQEILGRLQAGTAKYYDEFSLCPACDQVYWRGSHYENMLQLIRHSIQVVNSPARGADGN